MDFSFKVHWTSQHLEEEIWLWKGRWNKMFRYLLMSRETVSSWFFTHMAALCRKPPSLTTYSECWTNDWTPATHTFLSLSKRESFKAISTKFSHLACLKSACLWTVRLLTRQMTVCLILGCELKDSEQELLSREELETVLHGWEERGGNITDEGDEWLRVACIWQTLGLRQSGVELL